MKPSARLLRVEDKLYERGERLSFRRFCLSLAISTFQLFGL